MIYTIRTKKGRVIHVAPDNEPVFNASEIILMECVKGPEAAEILALCKEIFPGSKIETVEVAPQPTPEEEQMALLNFNAAEEQEMQDFELLPEGEYVAAIEESEMVENSKKNGHFLKLVFTVIEGPANGRKAFTNLNLDNPSEKAVEIARSELKSICSAVGKGNATVNDSEELHNLPLVIKIKHEARNDKPGEFSAKISKYSAVGGGAAPSAPPKAASAGKTGAKPPWVK